MLAKEELTERLKYLKVSISRDFIIDKPLSETEHNGVANILRKGLGILSFNILEDYIRKRTQEILHDISVCPVNFENLTERLKTASTIGALDALLTRVRFEKKSGGDWQKLIREESYNISKTIGSPFEICQYSLGWSGSNLGSDEVKDILAALGVDGGWTAIDTICQKIGSSLVNANSAYQNAATRRHDAAHNPSSTYLHSDLSSMPKTIISLSAAFDILATSAYRWIKFNPTQKIENNKISAGKLRFQKIVPKSGKWKLFEDGKKNAIKSWNDQTLAIQETRATLESKNVILLIQSASGDFEDWFT